MFNFVGRRVFNVHHLKTLGGSCELLILWEWTDRDGSINDDIDLLSPDETLSTDSDLNEEDLKCIGVTRDPSHQAVLKSVSTSLKEGKHVPVKIEAEPTNPY